MSQLHNTEEVRRFDWFKTSVMLVLFALLFFLARGCQNTPAQVAPTATAISQVQATQPTPTAVPESAVQATQPATAAAPVVVNLTEPSANARLTKGKTMLKGTSQPGVTIQVAVDGEMVGETKAGIDGAWAFEVDLKEPGSYTLGALAIDASGKALANSAAVPVTYAAPIGAPVLKSPTSADKLSSGSTTLTGAGTPGSEVEIIIDGRSIGKTKVSADGTWTFAADLGQAGTHRLQLRALDASGQAAAQSIETTLSVEAQALAAPTLMLPVSGETLTPGETTFKGIGIPGSEVEIVIDGKSIGKTKVGADGTWSFTTLIDSAGPRSIVVRALDATGQAAAESPAMPFNFEAVVPTITAPTINANVPNREVAVTGTGTPGSDLEILDNGQLVGTMKVAADGTWRFVYKPAAGAHGLSARVKGAASASEIVKLTVAAPAVLPASGAPCVGPRGKVQRDTYLVGGCDTLIGIGRRLGVDLSTLLAANPQITNPNRIYIGQVLALPR